MGRGPLWIVFNGEIYNFQEIRKRLQDVGHQFRGHSDTEVLLAAFLEWGVESTLPLLNGMFALALWDQRSRQLTLARDRYGKKPLYYGRLGSTWIFASELKAMVWEPGDLDQQSLLSYFRYGYVPGPRTIYRDIQKLQPGHWLTLSPEQSDSLPKRYWKIPEPGGPPASLEELECALQEAVRLRMVADVPLGAFLSGGVDSSLIVALMKTQSTQPVKTFCIGFTEKDYDESAFARLVADQLGTEHTELMLSPAQTMGVIPELPKLYDEPFADSSQIPTYLVSQLARQHVTVALSGDGGDEIFAGYNRYLWAPKIWKYLKHIPRPFRVLLSGVLAKAPLNLLLPLLPRVSYPREKLTKLLQVLPSSSPAQLYRILVSQWQRPDDIVQQGHECLLEWDFDLGTAEGMMRADALSYLPDDILVKVDRASMGVSLECRAPFLDPKVTEIAWRLPKELKLHQNLGKLCLRKLLSQTVHLPPRPKTGFTLPLGDWLRGDLRDWCEDLLSHQALQPYLRSQPIRCRWDEHLSGHRDWSASLWTVLMFQAWRRFWRVS